MKFPQPGAPVRGSQSGQPIMALFDLLGRTWSMGIIWHLHNGPSTFRQLQAYCENISPTILNKRIQEHLVAGLVCKTMDGYTLTKKGEMLYQLLAPLGNWAKKWASTFKVPQP